MSPKTYNVLSINPYIPPGHDFPLPMLSIQPENYDNFFQVAQKNRYNAILTISGTGKKYDNKPILCTISSSADFPDFRPNLWNSGQKYAILTLLHDWIGYEEIGYEGKSTVCVHFETEGDVKMVEKPYQPPTPPPWNTPLMEGYEDEKNVEGKYSRKKLYLLFLILMIAGLILLL